MAQAEAYYGCGQWVDYFLHAGHLSIRGLKMSKSLKNFVTIKEALRDHPARHLRLMFLMAQWDKGIVYSDQTLDDARSKDEKLRNFFSAARSLVSFADGAAPADGAAAPQSWRPEERRLSGALRDCRARVHAALCDNFDTPSAMAALFEVVGTCNVYMAQCGARARWAAVHEVARYVSRILQVFGVVAGADHLGFPAPESSSSSEQGGAAGREEVLAPVMQRVAAFRDGVRALARSKRDACGPEASRALLGLCDAFRDEACVDLGIRLEDRADGGSVVKSLSERPEVLRREIEERRAREREAASKKRENRRVLREKELKKWEAARVPVEEYFSAGQHAGKYGGFDDGHLPTAGADGEALSKAARKACEKEMGRHLAARKQLEEKSGGDADAFIEEIRREIRELSLPQDE